MMKKIIQNLLCVAVFFTATTVGLSQQTGVQITISPSPTLYSVMGGGSYCAGQPGVSVSLSGSEVGVDYQLVVNGTNTGLPVAGNGGGLNFGTQSMSGIYTVVATNINTGCSIQMSNSAIVQINPIPSISITTSGPVIFCGSGTVTLTASVVGGGCTYQWEHNGTPIPGANLNQYVANQTGMFTVIATNGNGCSNAHDTMVMVNPLPQQFTVSGSAPTFCQGSTGVTIDQVSSQTNINYQLMLNGIPSGVPVGGTGLALAWPNQAVAGIYSVVATDNTTACTNVMNGSAVVAMDPLPSAASTITGAATVCQGTTSAFSTNAILDATSYVWSVPTGATITSGQGTTMIQVDFTGASSGNIGVFGQNTCGSGQASTLAIMVNVAPTLTVTATGTDICTGASTNLTANGSGTSFVWSGGGNTQTISVNPTVTTPYTVTVTGSNSCTATGNITINVHALPSVTLLLAQDNFCTDVNTAQLSGATPSGGVWSGPAVFSPNGDIYPPVSGPGTSTVTYTYVDSWGCSNSATDNLTINPIPAVMFTNVVGTILTNTPAFSLAGNVSPSGGIFTGPGMVGDMFDPATAGPGNHMITYTYTHPVTGCSASQIQYINVGVVGIEEISAAADMISIFPNPAITKVNLSGINTKEISSLKIMNAVGQVVYSTEINDINMVIDVADFASGTYIISFINADGLSKGRMFMKTE